jgi:hypothetical protein
MVRGSVWKRIKTGDECFFLGESKLGDVLGQDYEELRSVLGKLARSTSVKALLADEGLLTDLVGDAEKVGGIPLKRLMQGFIGECKALMKGSEQSPPAPSLPQPKSELFVRGFWGFL